MNYEVPRTIVTRSSDVSPETYTLPDYIESITLEPAGFNRNEYGTANKYMVEIVSKRPGRGVYKFSYEYTISIVNTAMIDFDYKRAIAKNISSMTREELTIIKATARSRSKAIMLERKFRKEAWDSVYYGIMCGIGLDANDPGYFLDFCDEYGYETDSRKAIDLYLKCQELSRNFLRAFDQADLEIIQEIFQ